jgi:hypothetical protein
VVVVGGMVVVVVDVDDVAAVVGTDGGPNVQLASSATNAPTTRDPVVTFNPNVIRRRTPGSSAHPADSARWRQVGLASFVRLWS